LRALFALWHIKSDTPEKTFTRLIMSDIDFTHPRYKEGEVTFETSIFSVKKIKKWAEKEKIAITLTYEGTLNKLSFLKKRKGLIFGVLFSLFLIYLSTFYVWSVRIEGNETLTDFEIIKLLEECGFHEGINKREVDVNEIQNTALSRCHEISFLSINVHGMVADVVVHERQVAKKENDTTGAYNLVADFDGVIVSSLVLEGKAMFETGNTVLKGELLVSGIIDSVAGDSRLTHAKGKVFARTSRTLTFDVPLSTFEKRYIKEESAVALRVLGKRFGKKLGDESGDYDLVVVEEDLTFLGVTFPCKLERRHALYYNTEKTELDSDKAEKIAYDEYHRYILTELDSATILEEEFHTEEHDGFLRLTALVTAIENIATEKKIEIKKE